MMYIVPTCFIKNGTLTDPFILKYCYQNYLHFKKNDNSLPSDLS